MKTDKPTTNSPHDTPEDGLRDGRVKRQREEEESGARPPDPALGAAIRNLREARGLSQEALAYRAGTTYGTVNRLELAQSAPAWATVRALADALGVTLTELAAAIETAAR